MPSKQRLDDDAYMPIGLHYNVKYISGVICSHVTPRHFQGTKPAAIEWAYIRELKRHATTAEIAALCKGESTQQR